MERKWSPRIFWKDVKCHAKLSWFCHTPLQRRAGHEEDKRVHLRTGHRVIEGLQRSNQKAMSYRPGKRAGGYWGLLFWSPWWHQLTLYKARIFFFVSPCLLAFHGLWSPLSLPLSPPQCWPTQIGWTWFSLRFTLCTLTNLLSETLAASLQLLAPPISMVTEGRVLLGICLRELARTSCFPGIACPFAVNRAAWGEALPPAGWQAASRCRHLASLSWMSPGKYDVINRASAAGTIRHLTLIFHVSRFLSLS